MYTKQMATENRAMLQRAEELWGITQSIGLVMSYMRTEFDRVDEKRIRRWAMKANRGLRLKEIKSQKCFWHPTVNATHIVNLGSPIDLDTFACGKCVTKIQFIQNGFTIIEQATIKSMRDVIESEGG